MKNKIECTCNWHHGMGPNLKCKVHGTTAKRQTEAEKAPKKRALFVPLNLLVRLRCLFGVHAWKYSHIGTDEYTRKCPCGSIEIIRDCGVMGEYWSRIN